MIIGRLDSVSRHFGAETVLDNVSLEVHSGRRVGIIGRNGTGKTTLINLLSGRLEPDAGTVWVRPGCRVVIMEQIPDFGDLVTIEDAARDVFRDLDALDTEAHAVRERLGAGEATPGSEAEHDLLARLESLDEQYRRRGGFEIDFRVRSVLTGLGFAREDFAKPLEVLSGGEKSRVALARVLLSAPDLMLLDEPTNHLDIQAVEWLESYLRSWDGAVLVISHDRVLLDRVTQETVEVVRNKLARYPEPYSRAMEIRAAERELAEKRYRLQQQEIARQEDFIKKNIVDKKTATRAQSRRKMLEKMERLERPESDDAATRVSLTPKMPGGRDVLIADNIGADIAGRPFVDGVSFHLRKGDRLGVIGPNGSGKTTLLNVFASRTEPHRGTLIDGVGIVPGFLDQELASLDDRHSVLEEIQSLRPLAEQGELRSYLARFLFRGDDVFKDVSKLSGGERCRLALAKLFMEGPNLIFLDEPTNHLDIDGRQALEQALEDYTGTVVAVSHDRAFLNRFARTILHVHDGGGDLHLGNFDEFRARVDARAVGTNVQTASSGAREYESRKQEKRERDKLRRERRRKQARIVELEGAIAGAEEAMEGLTGRMAAPGLEPDALRKLTMEHRDLVGERDRLYAEWEGLVEEVHAKKDGEDGEDGEQD